MWSVLAWNLAEGPVAAAWLSAVAFAALLALAGRRAAASPSRPKVEPVPRSPQGKQLAAMSINEKAGLLLRNRSYECGITSSALGATSYEKWCYAEACLADVSAVFGPDVKSLLCRRHFGGDEVGRSISDQTMEALASDIWNLATVAEAQRSPFPSSAASLDERLRPWAGRSRRRF